MTIKIDYGNSNLAYFKWGDSMDIHLTMTREQSERKLDEHKEQLIKIANEIVELKEFNPQKIANIYATFYFYNGKNFSERKTIYQGCVKSENRKNRIMPLHSTIKDCHYLIEICF